MCRSNIPGNKKGTTAEISSKTTEYYLRNAVPLIKKSNNYQKLENTYENKTGKPLIHLDPELARRPSQMSDYYFVNLRDMPKTNDGNINYMHLNENARENKLINKDRKLDPIVPMNNVTRPHRNAQELSTDPTLGLVRVISNNKLSGDRLYDGNREPYMPQQFSDVKQNKVSYKVMS
tara:strand:- start:6870 stop:7400 length:531 start_codon:yes stop_codon:yes gene_type:complete